MNKLPTIDIKGKEYVQVKDRVLAFNEMCPNGSIATEIIKNDEISVVIQAIVVPDSKAPERCFIGHSEAYREGPMGDVPVEIAETSAVGRALGFMGIGVIEGIASADEIKKADRFGAHADTMTAGKVTPKQKDLLMDLCLRKGVKTTEAEIDALNSWQASQKIKKLMGMVDKVKSKGQETAEYDFEKDLDPNEEIPIIEE